MTHRDDKGDGGQAGPESRRPGRLSRHLGWVAIAAVALAVGSWAVAARHASPALAAASTPAAPCGPPVHIQSATAGPRSVTSLQVTLPAVTPGDFLVGMFGGAGNAVTVSDNRNGTWAAVAPQRYSAGIFYRAGAVGGDTTITFSGTSGSSYEITVDEFSGIALSSPLDQTSYSLASATSSWTAPATASIPQGELVYAGLALIGSRTLAAGTTNGVPMTLAGNVTGPLSSQASEYLASATAGRQNSSMTFSPAAYGPGFQATFKRPLSC
jgi:hypothetical protein